MSNLFKEVKVPYSCEQMFDLVVDIESYPSFLPWCAAASVFSQNETELDGSLTIQYKHFKQSFRTKNTHARPQEMNLRLIDGPFSNFCGRWRFSYLSSEETLVSFELTYTFKNMLLKMAAGAIFDQIAQSIIQSFLSEAKRRYGRQES